MELFFISAVCSLFFCGFFLLLQGSLVRLILGVMFLGNAVNLSLFCLTGLKTGSASFIAPDEKTLAASTIDPLAQAFILTAIVIGLGFLAFFLAVALRGHQVLDSDFIDGPAGDKK